MPNFAYVAAVTLTDGSTLPFIGDIYDRPDVKAAEATMVVGLICELELAVAHVEAFSAFELDEAS